MRSLNRIAVHLSKSKNRWKKNSRGLPYPFHHFCVKHVDSIKRAITIELWQTEFCKTVNNGLISILSKNIVEIVENWSSHFLYHLGWVMVCHNDIYSLIFFYSFKFQFFRKLVKKLYLLRTWNLESLRSLLTNCTQ